MTTVVLTPAVGLEYTTGAAVKAYLDISSSGDDVLLGQLVSRACAMIDRFCRRRFIAAAMTRLFDAPSGDTLWLDEDLLSVTAITNGDGSAVGSGQYVLLPANGLPKCAIRLRKSTGATWIGEEQAIHVQGTWGYSPAPPDDVVQAAIRLTAWLYKQRDAPFGTTARPDVGIVEVPAAIPVDVTAMLLRYQKVRVAAI